MCLHMHMLGIRLGVCMHLRACAFVFGACVRACMRALRWVHALVCAACRAVLCHALPCVALWPCVCACVHVCIACVMSRVLRASGCVGLGCLTLGCAVWHWVACIALRCAHCVVLLVGIGCVVLGWVALCYVVL